MIKISDLTTKKEKISIIGLGYVGLPIAVEFSKKLDVIGFDLNDSKIQLYTSGIDPTNEVGTEMLKQCNVFFTSKEKDLKKAKFHIVAVPTPINKDKTPDLTPLIKATELIGRNLTKESIVVFESTVYPGVTEDVCIPILEEKSNLKFGTDFKVGYSPERINPGDDLHKISNIVKVVSGSDLESLETISNVYGLIVKAGIHKASTIKVAEAAKVIENSQRDINIAFMNELSIIFNKMGINTNEVLEAASTKWNFINFQPGLVGGHCIGVDPYYLTYKAEQLGYRSQIILAGRRINDGMGKYVVDNVMKELVKDRISMEKVRIGILGFTFKENCPDTRNTKVIDIVNELKEYNIDSIIYDPYANLNEVKEEYNLNLVDKKDFNNLDVIILAVNHDEFKGLKVKEISGMYNIKNDRKYIFDIKETLSKKKFIENDFKYWSL